MDTGTKLIITLLVMLGIGSVWFLVGAGRQTARMDEDSKHLAMINSLEAQAEKAEERGVSSDNYPFPSATIIPPSAP